MKVWELEEGKEYIDKIFDRRYSIMNSELMYKNSMIWVKSDKEFKELMELDLEPYTPPTDWSKVEIDIKVLVRDFGNNVWSKRYFAEYKDGEYYAYADGKTSWSSDGDETQWNQMKLYTEE